MFTYLFTKRYTENNNFIVWRKSHVYSFIVQVIYQFTLTINVVMRSISSLRNNYRLLKIKPCQSLCASYAMLMPILGMEIPVSYVSE